MQLIMQIIRLIVGNILVTTYQNLGLIIAGRLKNPYSSYKGVTWYIHSCQTIALILIEKLIKPGKFYCEKLKNRKYVLEDCHMELVQIAETLKSLTKLSESDFEVWQMRTPDCRI